MLDLSNHAFDFKEILSGSESVLLSGSESLQNSIWLQSFVELLNTGLGEVFDSKECLIVGNDVSLDLFRNCSGAITVNALSALNHNIVSVYF